MSESHLPVQESSGSPDESQVLPKFLEDWPLGPEEVLDVHSSLRCQVGVLQVREVVRHAVRVLQLPQIFLDKRLAHTRNSLPHDDLLDALGLLCEVRQLQFEARDRGQVSIVYDGREMHSGAPPVPLV